MKNIEGNRNIEILHNAIMVGILVICLIVFILSIIPAEATYVAYAQDAAIDNQIYNLDIAVTNTSSNEENNLGTQPDLNGNAHYISNYKYFLQNPLHHVNDGADNIGGTCTTVAVQMLIGYHAYYSDKRIVPSKSTSGVQLLSDNFGKAETDPEFYQIPYAGLGDETIGTLDGLYEELWSHTTWPEFPGLGQNLIALKNAANEYVAAEAAEIKSNISIDYDSFDVNQAKSDIDNNLPIILGMSSISADANSYHVVVAYGYATINDVDGFIGHYGHRDNKVQIFVPTSYFSFQLRMSVLHTHSFLPKDDQNGDSVIKDTHKILECSECHSRKVDELYNTNLEGNKIIELRYAPLKNVSIPSNYLGIGNNVFKGTNIETISFCSNNVMIGDAAFENCEYLSEVLTTNKIAYIGKNAFKNCINLRSFTVGQNVSSIGQGAFAGCNNCDINVVVGNENFCSENNIVYDKAKTTIVASGKTASVLDLSEIQIVSASAFEGNNSITKLIFDQVEMGARAFLGCTNLSEVYLESFSVQSFGLDCFTLDSFVVYIPYYLQNEYSDLLGGYSTRIISRQFNVAYFVDNAKLIEQTCNYGAPIIDLPAPTKSGYAFAGWHKSIDLTDDAITSSDTAYWQEKDDISLYAEWSANTYEISFDGIGCDEIGNKTVVYNSSIGSLPTPIRSGYTFVGWKDKNGNNISSEDIYQMAENIVLSPIWKANSYTMTFNACGGTVDVTNLSCTYDAVVGAFPSVQRAGYDLIGWNDVESGEGTFYNTPFVYNCEKDLELFAQWHPITYSIIYNLNGGKNNESNPHSYTIESDDIILCPASKAGYSFAGWKCNDVIVSSIEQGTYGNITLDAQWEAKTYSVTLNSNGGTLEGENTLSVVYGETFCIPNNISRVGYNFEGWYDGNNQKYADANGECVKMWDKTENSVLSAHWSIKSYEIQINNNGTITWLGASGLSQEKCSIEYGTVVSAINLIAAFKNSVQGYREGHIFDHFTYGGNELDWNSIPDLGDDGAIITIIPVWIKESYVIYFYTFSDQIIPQITEEYDANISLPTNVTRSGYEFIGWSKSEVGELINWTKMPDLTIDEQNNGSIALYAQYSRIEYTITYVLNGGINAEQNPISYNIDSKINFADASRIGYEFKGWYLDGEFLYRISSIETGTENKTLFAKWEPISYKINYYANNGTVQFEISLHKYDITSTLRKNTFEKEGYTFNGWAISESGSAQFSDGQNIINLSSEQDAVINLYAVWSANRYQIKYSANGGFGTMSNSAHVYDVSSSLNGCTYAKTGYSFVGWAVSSEGAPKYANGESVKNLSATNNDTIILYAKWDPNTYKITFDMQGGDGGTTEIDVIYDSDLPSIMSPQRKGYIFKGYYDNTQGNGKQYYNNSDPSIGTSKYDKASNSTLYAFWEKRYYTVTIYEENGFVCKTVEVAYGDQMPDFATFAPEKDGYTFTGYFTEKNGKGTQYYAMAYLDDEQTAQIEGYDHYYCEQVVSCRKMDRYENFALYPGFSSLELDHTYSIYCNHKVIATQTIHVSGTNTTTTIYAPAVSGYTFSYFSYGGRTYNNSTASIPLKLKRSNTYSDGRIKLDEVLSAVYTENQDSCITPGMLITLANGIQVPVETLTGNEQLLVWNMFTGKFDSAPIVFIDVEATRMQDVIHLSFSDGTVVSIISEHAFWDIELNQYVYLDKNAHEYLGHHFNKQVMDSNGNMTWMGVQLTDVSITQEETTAWSPITYSHLCYYVNGMLSIPGGISGLFNYLTVDGETMTIDQSALASDIEKYGMFTFEEFSELVTITPESFEAFNGQYLKIAIGKGLITMEDIKYLLDRYAEFLN